MQLMLVTMMWLLILSTSAMWAFLGLLSLHRLWLVMEFARHGEAGQACPAPIPPRNELPAVCVQIPLYNEPAVAARVIAAVARLDYPSDLLEIQILDDSDDRTPQIVAHAIANSGMPMSHIRRENRIGYKAGALAHGMEQTSAELIGIFDADFVPDADFLLKLVGHFTNPTVAVVQARWGHLNRNHSLLTRLQAFLIDAHFAVDHRMRHARGRFFNFNGTAGIWRRSAIVDAGGWQHDTLTEDLDLSIRAQLRGWHFVYRDDVECPAELPDSMAGFRSQQARWVKGSVETCRKLLATLWRSEARLAVKVDTTGHLLANFAYPALLIVMILIIPQAILGALWPGRSLAWFDLAIVLPGLFIFAAFFGLAARRRALDLAEIAYLVPLGMLLGLGMCVANARAAFAGALGKASPFVRTPKSGGSRKRARGEQRWLEGILAGVFALLLGLQFTAGFTPMIPVLTLFLSGLLLVTVLHWTGGWLSSGTSSRCPFDAPISTINSSRRERPSVLVQSNSSVDSSS